MGIRLIMVEGKKKMMLLKFKLFMLEKSKAIFITILIIVFAIISYWITQDKFIVLEEIDASKMGVIGTLFGAIIGGVFSLLGSVWVNNKQLKGQYNLKRKNHIYSPLYDELVDIQERILPLNPYPNYIVFRKGQQTLTPHPQYSAWNRIKGDTRILDVPKYLVKKMNSLDEAIQKYLVNRPKVNECVKEILNTTLQDNNLQPSSIINIGDSISSDILINQAEDILNKVFTSYKSKDIVIDKDLRDKINKEIFMKANECETVKIVRVEYENMIKIQQEAIQMIGVLIQIVNKKYY